MFLKRMQIFLVERETFARKLFVRECKISRITSTFVRQCKISQGNAKHLWENEYILWGRTNVSWGNAICLRENTNVLRENANVSLGTQYVWGRMQMFLENVKFIGGMQYFCERTQIFCERMLMFCERMQMFLGGMQYFYERMGKHFSSHLIFFFFLCFRW